MTALSLTPRVRSGIFEILRHGSAHSSRLTLWAIAFLFVALLLWSCLARLDIVAVAEGRLVPQTYLKIVQPAEGGIVRELLVSEGQHVRRDQVLLRLDPTLASADRRSAAAQLALKRLEMRRIDAQLTGHALEAEAGDDPALLAQVRLDGLARERAYLDQIAQEEATRVRSESELAAARETLAKLERTLPSYEQSAQAYEQLAKEKLVGALDAEAKQREAIEHAQDLKTQVAYVASLESSLRAQQKKVVQLTSAYRSTLQSERSQRLGEVNQLTEEFRKQGFREGLLELRAPQEGIVKDVATTTIGAVVQPGTVLLTLVPEHEPLRAEVYVRNEDVGFVREGQHVRIKIAAYPFTKYGLLEGTVQTLSADASRMDEASNAPRTETTAARESPSMFKAIVQLKRQRLESSGLHLPIVAGMTVQAEIREDERTVLEYLLSPVKQVADEAGGER
jgi:membrane fusion protein, hemolysin D